MRARQGLMFYKDQTPTKRQWALRNEKELEPLKCRWKVGLTEEPLRIVCPGWDGQFPPARQMLGDGTDTGIKPWYSLWRVSKRHSQFPNRSLSR